MHCGNAKNVKRQGRSGQLPRVSVLVLPREDLSVAHTLEQPAGRQGGVGEFESVGGALLKFQNSSSGSEDFQDILHQSNGGFQHMVLFN